MLVCSLIEVVVLIKLRELSFESFQESDLNTLGLEITITNFLTWNQSLEERLGVEVRPVDVGNRCVFVCIKTFRVQKHESG